MVAGMLPPPPRAAVAAWLCMLLLAAGDRPAAAAAARPACTAAAPFGKSSFALKHHSTRPYVSPKGPASPKAAESWRRDCFTITKRIADDPFWAGAGAGATCSAGDACCSTFDSGPRGIASLTIGIDAACTGGSPAARAAFKRTWWSLGDRTQRAPAKLLAVSTAGNSGGGGGGAFQIKLPACEQSVWAATELCVNLLDVPENACRRPQELCGDAGCPVTAVTGAFEDESGAPGAAAASCCLNGTLPHVCDSSCPYPYVCGPRDLCVLTMPQPAAVWDFDECSGAALPDSTGGATAYFGKGAQLKRCASPPPGGGSTPARPCVAAFDSSGCCGSPPCGGAASGLPSCGDRVGGALVTLLGPPGPAGASPPGLVFDGLKEFTVSGWVNPAEGKRTLVAGRYFEGYQFALTVGVSGLPADTTSINFDAVLECAPSDAGCSDYKAYRMAGGAAIPGAWTHVAGVFDGNFRVYQNGQRVAWGFGRPPYAQGQCRIKARGGGVPIVIGGATGGVRDMQGGAQIDCVGLYTSALADEQVAELYRCQVGKCGCGPE